MLASVARCRCNFHGPCTTMATIISHTEFRAWRALRGDLHIAELLTIIRLLAADRRAATRDAITLLRETRNQVNAATAAEFDNIIAELEIASLH